MLTAVALICPDLVAVRTQLDKLETGMCTKKMERIQTTEQERRESKTK